MLAPFSPKVGRCCGVLPSSLLRCLFYPTFSRSCPRLYTILARFWRFWTPSGRVVGPIFAFFWCQVGALLGHLDARMVLDIMKYSCLARRNARSDPPPNGDGVLNHSTESANLLGSIFQGQVPFRSLPNPLPNPLLEAAHSAWPPPHSPAFALLAPLGWKNRVPRGLQKMINV